MVAGRGEGVGETFEDALPVVGDLAGLAVHEDVVAFDRKAVHVRHALVPQTDTQDGDAPGEPVDDRRRDARLLGGARARRDHDVRRTAASGQRLGLVGRDPVVARDEEIPPQLERRIELAEALHEIPRERVVVVDEKDHATMVGPGA